jgi:hypothetical protein
MEEAVGDVASQLGPEELAELCALADGTLPADRRAEVEARVAASPELQELVERQRRAVAATAGLAADEPSPSLRAAVEGLRPAGARITRPRRLVPRFVLGGALVAGAAVLAAVLLTGGPGAPTVADAAGLAAKPPVEPPPAQVGDGARLAIGVDGVTFPDFAGAYGWTPLGVRHGSIDGRDVTVVYYAKGDRRLAYAIVSGARLPRPSGGETELRRGVPYQAVTVNDRLVVTWPRAGHTCVLIGDASSAELLELASWPLGHRPR